MTVYENVEFALRVTNVPSRHIRKRVAYVLQLVRLGDKARCYPRELSGGQQQRVAIARALAMQPDILCFDEPTSALDPELTGEVLKVIRELSERGRTMIVVTHEMEFARQVSDDVIFMADGVIEEEGNPLELFSNPKSEKLRSFLNGINK
jgi:ABC-type histidine transport system ATPase subunit